MDLMTATPDAARLRIRAMLDEADDQVAGKIYAALAHKVWAMLSQRRFSQEVRDWHGLLLATKAAVSAGDARVAAKIEALADLLGETISYQETVAPVVLESPYAAASFTDERVAALCREYEEAALTDWPGVNTPHYALSGAFKIVGERLEKLVHAGQQAEPADA